MVDLKAFEVDYRVDGDPELKQSLVKVDLDEGLGIDGCVAKALRCAHGAPVQVTRVWVPRQQQRA